LIVFPLNEGVIIVDPVIYGGRGLRIAFPDDSSA